MNRIAGKLKNKTTHEYQLLNLPSILLDAHQANQLGTDLSLPQNTQQQPTDLLRNTQQQPTDQLRNTQQQQSRPKMQTAMKRKREAGENLMGRGKRVKRAPQYFYPEYTG